MQRSIALDVLNNVRIASPCPMRWEDMRGTGRVRHCEHCDLNVYNLSAMTPEDAADLVTRAEGRLCATFYRRADGTMIPSDCPVGLRARAARVAGACVRIAAGVAAMVTAAVVHGNWRSVRVRDTEPYASLMSLVRGPQAAPMPSPGMMQIMGEVRVAPGNGGD